MKNTTVTKIVKKYSLKALYIKFSKDFTKLTWDSGIQGF